MSSTFILSAAASRSRWLPTAALPTRAAAWVPNRAWAGPAPRAGSVVAVLAVHVVLALALWQGWRHPAKPLAPLLVPVHWIAPAEPHEIPQPTQARAPAAQPREAAAPQPADTPVTTPSPGPVAESRAPRTEAAAPESPAVAAPAMQPPQPQALPAPVKVTLHAPRYLVEPKLTLPLASRRLGEQGLVQLRLHIGTQGELLAASVARSSGFERLDAQALKDIRTARFSPWVDNGHAVEWECLALLSYELTR